MFPDLQITNKFTCAQTKLYHSAVFVLGPHFQENLMFNEVSFHSKSQFFLNVSMFLLNKIKFLGILTDIG